MKAGICIWTIHKAETALILCCSMGICAVEVSSEQMYKCEEDDLDHKWSNKGDLLANLWVSESSFTKQSDTQWELAFVYFYFLFFKSSSVDNFRGGVVLNIESLPKTYFQKCKVSRFLLSICHGKATSRSHFVKLLLSEEAELSSTQVFSNWVFWFPAKIDLLLWSFFKLIFRTDKKTSPRSYIWIPSSPGRCG